MIQVSDLTKTFRLLTRRPGFLGGLRTLFSADYRELRAVDGVSFSVAPGELVGYPSCRTASECATAATSA
jgi:ABC-2 type transport system ATP-binding protein